MDNAQVDNLVVKLKKLLSFCSCLQLFDLNVNGQENITGQWLLNDSDTLLSLFLLLGSK